MDLAFDMFARLRGDGRARAWDAGRDVSCAVCACAAAGRGFGARARAEGGRAAVPRRVGVDAGACGLAGSRRRWFLWSRFHLRDANIFGGARAARNGGARGTWVRGALLEAVGVADTAAHGLFWEPREVSCFFACAAGASRGAPGKARTAPRRVVCGHSRCDSFRRAILGRWDVFYATVASRQGHQNGLDKRGVSSASSVPLATTEASPAPVAERKDVWPISSGSSISCWAQTKRVGAAAAAGRTGRQPTNATAAAAPRAAPEYITRDRWGSTLYTTQQSTSHGPLDLSAPAWKVRRQAASKIQGLVRAKKAAVAHDH